MGDQKNIITNDKEIQILMRQMLSKPDSLLNISDEVKIKEEEVLEKPKLSPDNQANNKPHTKFGLNTPAIL